ncbi:MAG: hypothetical protein JJU29_18935 [Verrucomicrobia bacterium]|nr:hypothetical protein [Verrucomicrobiota bacterium]MCH8514126.1 hypothetical protein [Kiritimatiellia bacterium]
MKWTTIKGTEGFIRVAQNEDGQWWMLDAEGNPFVTKAVAGVNRAGTTGGRLAKPGPYADAVDRLYDYQTSPDLFVETELNRLREWGFNTLGSWVTPEFFDRGMFYTDIIDFRPRLPEVLIKVPGFHNSDVFDPRFQEGVDRLTAEFCPPRRDQKEFMGWFVDNEAGWGQPGTDHVWGGDESLNAKGTPTLLQIAMALEEDRPLKRAAWDFVTERYGKVANIAGAWNFPFEDEADFRVRTEAGARANHPKYGEDNHVFSKKYATEYFRITGESIRRHDPNHLLLGCRFGAPPGHAIAEACRESEWIDVISANNYRETMKSRMDEFFGPMQKPLLIGEYAWCSDYHALPGRDPSPLGDPDFPEDLRVEIKGRVALEESFTHPAVIGYTWYRWIQRVEPERPWRNYSLVGIEDEVNPFNTRLLKEINPKAEAIRKGELAPVTRDELLAQHI